VAEAGQRPSAVIHYSVLPPLPLPSPSSCFSSLRPPPFLPPLLLKTPQASNRCTDWFLQDSSHFPASTGIGNSLRLDRHRDPAPPRQAPGPTPPQQASEPYSASACTPERPGQWILAAAGGVSHRFVAPAIAKLDSRWVRFPFRCVQTVPPRRAPLVGRVIRGRCGGGVHSSRPSLDSLVLVLLPDFGFPLFGSRLDRLWERSSPRQALGRL
jgi:hypothetical protein